MAELVENIEQSTEIPKRKRGRPPKTEKKEEVLQFNPDAIRTLLNFIFNILADRLGQHWKLKENELEILSDAWDKFLKENAKFLSKNFTTINFVLINAIVIVPRILRRKDEKQNNNDIGPERTGEIESS